jgi:hypothetical protein
VQFLYPFGLLALIGLLIPLIIHLWNVKQGKTLKIGSISLLGESARSSSKSIKINDLLLFILRCLILICIALLLAQPYLPQKLDSKSKSGWILVRKDQFDQVYKENSKIIDSLIRNGYEIHDFNLGFNQLSLKDTITLASQAKPLLSNTSLLSELNRHIPSGYTVYLYADQRLQYFGNELPPISYRLYWKQIQQSDTLSSWITDFAGKKYEGKSNPSSTTYQALNIAEAAPIRVAIYEAPGGEDQKYLISALKAIAKFSNRPLQINPSSGLVTIGFWLSDDVVSPAFKASIVENGKILQYEKGKSITSTSNLDIDGALIKLYKHVPQKGKGEVIWSDGFGSPILTTENVDKVNILHFYSRFNPQWSELVWNEAFVKAMMAIIFSDGHSQNFGFEEHQTDQRMVSLKQSKTAPMDSASATTILQKQTPIHFIFWLAAFLMIVLERILSLKQKKHEG